MSSPACCLSQQSFDLPEPPTTAEIRAGRPAPASGRIDDQLALLQRAAEMMATGALSEDQAKTLSRQILQSVA